MTQTEVPTVLAKRNSTRHDDDFNSLTREANVAFVSEVLRNSQLPANESPRTEEKISVFWRVFGGTILSIVALLVIQAYQSLNNNIHELRTDQNRMRDAAADFIKKDDLATRTTSLWNRVQELQNLNAAVSVATNKLAALEQQLGAADRDRKEIQVLLAQFTTLKERVTLLDEAKRVSDQDHKELLAMAAALHGLRERDMLLEKQLREAETERKDFVRELQAMRERLAKLEGAQQPAGSSKSLRPY